MPRTKKRVELTPALANAKPTARSLADHHYQRKLAAHFAPQLLPSTFQSLKNAVEDGNVPAMKMVLELYELVQNQKSISIINDNRQVTVDARGQGANDAERGERRDFEAVARMLDEARTKRLERGNPLAAIEVEGFAITPEGVSK